MARELDPMPDFRTYFHQKTGIEWDDLYGLLLSDAVPKVANVMADYMDEMRERFE